MNRNPSLFIIAFYLLPLSIDKDKSSTATLVFEIRVKVWSEPKIVLLRSGDGREMFSLSGN